MKQYQKTIYLLFFLLITLSSSAWRLEGNRLIIEKGDNLYEIAHSLFNNSAYADSIYNDLRIRYPTFSKNNIQPDWEYLVPERFQKKWGLIKTDSLYIIIEGQNNIDLHEITTTLSSIDTNIQTIINEEIRSDEVGNKDWKLQLIGFIFTYLAGLLGWNNTRKILTFIGSTFKSVGRGISSFISLIKG